MRFAIVLVVLARVAAADSVTVGVFAPSAPFPSTAARVELASRLGDHIGKALGGTGIGRVYARAGDFAGAVKKGEITIALVDAAYLAIGGGGPYTVIASAQRSADGWQLVARGKGKVGDLKGKRVLVPANGGRETDFVINVMLGGEVARDFVKVEVASDTASALGALGLGKADAAVVPAGVDLPPGTSTIVTLPALAGPTLVAYGTLTQPQRATLVAAATSFKGDATIAGFRAGDPAGIGAIAVRMRGAAAKHGPLAVPAVRLVVGDLLEGRSYTIERTSAATFAVEPKR